jgi:hypothetical protein
MQKHHKKMHPAAASAKLPTMAEVKKGAAQVKAQRATSPSKLGVGVGGKIKQK